MCWKGVTEGCECVCVLCAAEDMDRRLGGGGREEADERRGRREYVESPVASLIQDYIEIIAARARVKAE